MATTKKTKKKDGPRTKRYGCTTYRSEPQDNPDCRGRCSPPARMVSQDGSTKVTQIRYRRRNLDVVRKNCACDLRPPSKTKKTAAKKTASKTAKAPSKTVKTVKKAPAKKTAVKTVKKPVAKPTAKKTPVPPVKVTPLGRYIDGIILGVPQPIPTAVRIILPTDSVFEWYVRTWPDDDLALEIDHRLKFAQVKKAMGTSAIYKVIGVGDSVVRERIETGIRELYRDGVPANLSQALMTAKKTASKTVSCGCAVTPAKSPSKPKTVTCGCAQTPAKKEPIKAPASWKVPAVGGKFENKGPYKMIEDAIKEKAAKTDFGAVLDDAMRARAMAVNLTDWQREALSRPYIDVYYNKDRNRYLIYGRMAKENADDLTPAEAVQKLKTIGQRTPVIMNPHDPFRGKTAAKSDIIAVLMARPDYAPAMKNGAVKKNAKAMKIPVSWKVPTVGGKFEGKAEPIKAPASWKVPAVGGKFEGKAPAKSTAKTPAKKTSAKKNTAAPASRGVQGRFDAGALKAVAQFIHKMDKDLDMPIFSNDTQFIDSRKVIALRLVSRMPGRSFVGLPMDQSKRDLAVPMDSLIKRLNSEVMDVYYKDGRLYYSWKDSPELAVSTAVRESNNPYVGKFVWSRTSVEGDIRFRTTQAKFASDVKKTIQSAGVKLPTKYTAKTEYRDTAMSMCPPNGAVGYDEDGHIPPQCAGYSMYWMNQIAGLVAKAKGSQCIVMFKPNFPLRIVCDLGPYMAEIMLAPVYTPEE